MSLPIIGVSAMALSAFATWLVLCYARRRLVDIPNERSSHSTPTPRGGGLGLVAAVVGVTGIAAFFAASGWESSVLLSTVAFMAAIGWWDDHSSLPASGRLAAHLLSMAVIAAVLGVPTEIHLGAWAVPLPAAVAWALAILGGAWMVNLTNFMDGIDGIAGVQGAIACAAFAMMLIPADSGTSLPPLPLLVATAGACVGFLVWNWPPASIFLGDVGSTALGLVMAAAMLAVVRSGLAVDLALLPVAPFVADATCTLVRRAWRRERLSSPHRSHLYQRLARRWGSHVPVTLLYAALALLGWGLGESTRTGRLPAGMAFACWTVIYGILAMWGRRVAPV